MAFSAHEGDLKEANKQKCQHPASQASQMVFQTQPQSTAQYLQRPALQYTQANLSQPSQGLSQAHGLAPYLTHATTLQPSGTLGQGQAISAPLDPKGNLASRGYQLNALYTCATTQFER